MLAGDYCANPSRLLYCTCLSFPTSHHVRFADDRCDVRLHCFHWPAGHMSDLGELTRENQPSDTGDLHSVPLGIQFINNGTRPRPRPRPRPGPTTDVALLPHNTPTPLVPKRKATKTLLVDGPKYNLICKEDGHGLRKVYSFPRLLVLRLPSLPLEVYSLHIVRDLVQSKLQSVTPYLHVTHHHSIEPRKQKREKNSYTKLHPSKAHVLRKKWLVAETPRR